MNEHVRHVLNNRLHEINREAIELRRDLDVTDARAETLRTELARLGSEAAAIRDAETVDVEAARAAFLVAVNVFASAARAAARNEAGRNLDDDADHLVSCILNAAQGNPGPVGLEVTE